MNSELIAILVGTSIGAFVCSTVSLGIACLAWSTVVGLKNSTHQVQYVPIGEDGDAPSDQAALQDKYDRATGQKFEDQEYT